jgi:hypothetical protein
MLKRARFRSRSSSRHFRGQVACRSLTTWIPSSLVMPTSPPSSQRTVGTSTAAPGLVGGGGHQALPWSLGPPHWRADPPPPARPPGRAILRWRVGPVSGRRRSELKPVAVPAEMQRTQLVAGLADQVAFADQDLVGLCRGLRYAERSPGIAGRRPRGARNRGITLGRPLAYRAGDGRALIAEAGLPPAPAPSQRARVRNRSRVLQPGESTSARAASPRRLDEIRVRTTGGAAGPRRRRVSRCRRGRQGPP